VDGDLLHALVVRQPLLDRPARLAGKVVHDDVEVARGDGVVDGFLVAQVAGGVARGGGERDLSAYSMYGSVGSC